MSAFMHSAHHTLSPSNPLISATLILARGLVITSAGISAVGTYLKVITPECTVNRISGSGASFSHDVQDSWLLTVQTDCQYTEVSQSPQGSPVP